MSSDDEAERNALRLGETVSRSGRPTGVFAPVCAYAPLTGPVPEGLAPGEEFTHWAVQMTPALAQALLDRYTDRARALSDQGVQQWMWTLEHLGDDSGFTSIHDEVHVSQSGETVAGQHLLHAVVRSGVTVSVDVVHNSERSRP